MTRIGLCLVAAASLVACSLILVPIDARAESALADSLLIDVETMVVSGARAPLPSSDKTRVEMPAIEMRDPGSLADLGGLIPSARVATNSRGDSHLMIRGAPERHVQTFLDGIPLNLPWDERVDLQTIPITGTGRLEGNRGLTTLMDGPGVLAGSVNIVAGEVDPDAAHNRVNMVGGDHVFGRTNLQHSNRFGAWDVVGATGWQGRNSFNLPQDVVEKNGADRRLNSDLSQYSALLRGSRPVAHVGRLNLLATAWSAEKGVPAELHLPADRQRHWRYPVRRRALLGASLALPLNQAGTWDLSTAISADFFNQEIDPRGPDDWDTELVNGQDYEKNWDRTGFAKIRATHWFNEAIQVAVQTTGRYTHHREILTVGGQAADYSQWLASMVAEAEIHPADRWRVRLGAGLDHAATPQSGPQPSNDGDSHPAWNVRTTHTLPNTAELHLAASLRSRTPSLRELYSGSLGRFVPNAQLRPEQQNLYEVGYAQVHGAWRLETAAFLLYLEDGIEKVGVTGTDQFERVNQTEIRVPGFEVSGGWRLRHDVDLSLQHTILAARVKADGGFDNPAEDRPDYLSRAGLNWTPHSGPGALVESVLTGARWSADATAPDGLRRLPAGVVWNLRVRWVFVHPARQVEFMARLDNVFNQRVDDQAGLPNVGQTFSGGATISF